jgi:hypothetical protein
MFRNRKLEVLRVYNLPFGRQCVLMRIFIGTVMCCLKKLFLLTIAVRWVGPGSGYGSLKSGYRYGSEDTDPNKNLTYPEHCNNPYSVKSPKLHENPFSKILLAIFLFPGPRKTEDLRVPTVHAYCYQYR